MNQEDNTDRTPFLTWLLGMVVLIILAFIGLIKVMSWVYNLVNDLIEKI